MCQLQYIVSNISWMKSGGAHVSTSCYLNPGLLTDRQKHMERDRQTYIQRETYTEVHTHTQISTQEEGASQRYREQQKKRERDYDNERIIGLYGSLNRFQRRRINTRTNLLRLSMTKYLCLLSTTLVYSSGMPLPHPIVYPRTRIF